MSYLSSQYIQCEAIQSMLDEQFTLSNAPLDPMPALEAILATQKANGISQSVSDGSGKVKSVKVVYDQRLLESAVTDSSGARTCTTTTETFDNYTTYTIDPAVWLKAEEKFDTVDLATVCTEDVQSMIAKKINKIVDVLDRKVATQTAEELVGLTGEWSTAVTANGSDELEIATLISAATKQIDNTGMVNLNTALMQTGYNAPIIIGGTTLYNYGQRLQAGCCATTGVNVLDMYNQFGKAFLWDKRVSTALADPNKSMVFNAGAVALITYNEAPQVPNLGANYAKFRVNSPRTGIPYDIVMNDTCGTISILGYANTKLVGLPTDMFAVGDEFRGVTMVNKIKVVNPA